ncbi:MAG TPA: ABC transporter ATP-binding protein [Candidatus Hydrogenedentes bacterium]|nr:ABC transporter ATP-binding protein [Candidatus Hydrogenedentota bacterium]
MPVVVKIQNVTKRYRARVAVQDVNLAVEAGQATALLGPDGAGKSTILSIVSGLVRPTSGVVSLFGKEMPRGRLDVSPRIGVFVESPAFFEHLSLRRNLLMQARLAGRPVNVTRVLDWVGLVPVANERPLEMPRPLRRRLALAQALLTEPELLLLDEPFLGLDLEDAQPTFQLLRRLREEAGVTILFATRLMRVVEVLCDRAVVLRDGRLVAEVAAEDLIAYEPSEVEVILDGPETAARKLADQPWVAQVDLRPGRIFVRLRDKNAAHLNAFLVAAGYRVHGLLPRGRTLQDVLLKVTNE